MGPPRIPTTWCGTDRTRAWVTTPHRRDLISRPNFRVLRVASPSFSADPGTWPAARHGVGPVGFGQRGRVSVEAGHVEGDPTGCGDVWGATLFSRLLAGDDLEDAMRTANGYAARNVAHMGARGLTDHLLGRPVNDAGDR